MYVQVLPEYGLVVDPLVGIVTTAGESFAPVLEQITILESAADDLVNMLSGEGMLSSSFPGREQTLKIAGGITAFWYGIAVGLFLAGIIAFQLIRMG
ncbi:tetrahydromethanopterin S-methyltransferase subunit MtrB [Methanosphaerula subterraneus]|jgi:tetrahydromethanopterin S-methyltransferase subunit B|uniref:tetrahydromethanopterin S-methyltransferase subunit MtrB n=1 Tax=Methanosphaerula subterraneus TaxID=3350244 RepID=UPI003F86CFD3